MININILFIWIPTELVSTRFKISLLAAYTYPGHEYKICSLWGRNMLLIYLCSELIASYLLYIRSMLCYVFKQKYTV
jgi:hypothetical protein